MATKKKRFLEPQNVECSANTVKKATPRRTKDSKKSLDSSNFRGMARRARKSASFRLECNPFSLIISRVKNLSTNSTESLNFWMIKFVQEVWDKDPGNTIYKSSAQLSDISNKMVEQVARYWNFQVRCTRLVYVHRVI